MSYAWLSDNEMLQIFSFLIKWFNGTLQNCFHILKAIFFAITEIYVKKYKTYWKIVKTTFDKFFRCIRFKGFTAWKSMSSEYWVSTRLKGCLESISGDWIHHTMMFYHARTLPKLIIGIKDYSSRNHEQWIYPA